MSSVSLTSIYPCVKCQVCYQGYKQLLEHLYWRHGTESVWCSACALKRWVYADHICHVLPIDDDDNASVSSEDSQYYSERETEFCYCGKNISSPMIGCDGSQCVLQWYHFKCVGIVIPPLGDWLCPDCSKKHESQLTPLAADTLTAADGVHCTVKHEGKIYRAILTDTSDANNVRAVLPDYGNTIATLLTNLMILPTELNVYYYPSLECCLNNYSAESTTLIPLMISSTSTASRASDLVAKPVSLNELIAAESKQKQTKQQTKLTAGGKTVSLNELIAAENKQSEKKSPLTRPTGRGSKPFTAEENYPAESQKLEKSQFPKTSAKKPRRKSFSLKDLFAAESSPTKRRIESLLTRTPGAGLFSRRRSIFPALSRKPFESVEDLFSPLRFRKKFEIKSPLKPKKIKYSFTPRLKRRKESTKRETNENEIFEKHIPLIKRIGLLVDDILAPDSGESVEHTNRRKPRRNEKSNIEDTGTDLEPSASKPQKTAIAVAMVPPEITTDTDNPTSDAPDTTTPHQLKSTRNKKSINENDGTDLEPSASESRKTAITTTMVPPEITTDTEDPTSEAPDTTTHYPPSRDVDALRPDPDISLPPARNTSRHRGNDNGVSERSSPAFHRDFEGYITRNNRSDEHHSGRGGNQTHPSSNEENSCSSTRINKCRDESRDGSRYPNDLKTKETKTPSYNGLVRRDDIERENILQVGREEEPLQIPRNVRRLPGPLSDKVVIVDAESVPPKKYSEKSFDSVAFHHTSSERGTERNGPVATENQRIRQVTEGMIPMQGLLNPYFTKQHGQQNPVVVVFDGYSVARDINGRNELTERSIRISPH